MNEHREQAESLLAAGVRDQITLQLLLESGRAPHESIGFHAQQACEKFIKWVSEVIGSMPQIAPKKPVGWISAAHPPLAAATVDALRLSTLRNQ